MGRERVLASKTYVGGVMLAPGSIRAGVAGKHTFIGELDGQRTSRVQAIAEAFNGAGLATTVSDNILGTMWDKLLVNVATGALSGITMLSYGQLYSEPLLESTAKAAVSEAIAVAERAGIRLSLTSPDAAWCLAAEGLPASFRTSMLQSLEKARSPRSISSTAPSCAGASATAWLRRSTRPWLPASRVSSAPWPISRREIIHEPAESLP